LVRGDDAVVSFAVEAQILEPDRNPSVFFRPRRVTVQYCMPPETGPKVEGEGLAFEPPVRIIEQIVELEEE
ncbi:MAG: hypothetical protein JXP34_13685, partial [Planctomycetes bacterium]|nr:hypothetical protein [Planctomycetota bacterium]